MHLNLLKQLKKQTNTNSTTRQQSKRNDKNCLRLGKIKVFDDKTLKKKAMHPNKIKRRVHTKTKDKLAGTNSIA